MKIIRTNASRGEAKSPINQVDPSKPSPWKLLVVDDEPDVHSLTRLNLKGFQYAGRNLLILEARSGVEARELFKNHPDIALALVDVVMETEDAGLRLVEDIRQNMGNKMVRLLIRTGQPGAAPERFVIDHFDIDGYHDKTDLTAQRLYTSVRSAIKSYRDLRAIDLNRTGLAHVLQSTAQLYHFRRESIQEFFKGVLTQVIGLFQLGDNAFISTIEGMIITIEGEQIELQAGIGAFSPEHEDDPKIQEIGRICSDCVRRGIKPDSLPEGCMLLPIKVDKKPVGFLYLEHTENLTPEEKDLIQILSAQCGGALENLRLNIELKDSYEHLIQMLALTAEYKDKTTGEHISRIAHLTTSLALEMGLSETEAHHIGQAAQLHDVGKVGIPDHILQKPGKLTPEEFEMVKRHTRIGADILAHDGKLELDRSIALMHHEQWSGGGYPFGIQGEDIPIAARIVSVIDVYDALIHERPYKEAWPEDMALDYLEKEKGIRFDPAVVDAFLRVIQKEDQ
jgi:response regulator RpfG family c-di-GMP phosphodiesterase